MLLRAIVVSFLAILLSACGNLQAVRVAQLPDSLQARALEFGEERPSKDVVMPRAFEIPGKSAFVQQTSGGSLAVGLLFGPLGVLANSANIDRITRETGESGLKSGLYEIDAKVEAQLALAGQVAKQPTALDEAKRIKATPFLVYFVSDEKIGVDVVVHLRAEANVIRDGKSAQWVGSYAMPLETALPIEYLSKPMTSDKLEGLKSSIRKAYDELYGELAADLMQRKLPERQIAWVKSRILGYGTPGIPGAGAPGDIERNKFQHLVLRTFWGEGKYGLVVFPNDELYSFTNGPVARVAK